MDVISRLEAAPAIGCYTRWPLFIRLRKSLRIYDTAALCQKRTSYSGQRNRRDLQPTHDPIFWRCPCYRGLVPQAARVTPNKTFSMRLQFCPSHPGATGALPNC
jgi:hypothetical protein